MMTASVVLLLALALVLFALSVHASPQSCGAGFEVAAADDATASLPRRGSDGRRNIGDVLAEARARLRRLQPREALDAQRHRGALIVDTRSSDQRRRDGIIPGSLHVPLSVLQWRLDPDADPRYRNRHAADLGKFIVLVCEHGFSSSLAAASLQDIGFALATDVVGGFEAWAELGLPVVAWEMPPEQEPRIPGLRGPD